MSRIGKHPVVIPEGVDVTIDGQSISATGRLGAMSMLIHKEIVAVKDNNAIIVPSSYCLPDRPNKCGPRQEP